MPFIPAQDPTLKKIAEIARQDGHETFLKTLEDVRQESMTRLRDTLTKGLPDAQVIGAPKLNVGRKKTP